LGSTLLALKPGDRQVGWCMDDSGDAFASALAAEQVRNARAINFFRPVFLTLLG